MLVEDPRDTLKGLCTFADSEVDLASFKLSYEKMIGRGDRPIHIKHAHTHFYTLTLFKLLVPETHKGKYRLSLVAKNLCTLLASPNRKDEYQKILSEVLLINESKGKLFEDFLQFVTEKKSKKDIDQRFKPIPARTLIAWSKEAGLIQEYQNFFQAIPRKKTKPTQAQFKDVLIKIYTETQTTEVFGIKRIYVPIGGLRFNVCVELGLKKEEFDDELKYLLSTEYGTRITLHGAPTNVYEEEETFNYSGKLYIYLSIKV